MIRFIIIVIYIALFAILSLVLLPIEYLIGLKYPLVKQRSSQKIVKYFFLGALWLSGVRRTIKGLDRIPTDQPVLYIANHRSIFDVLLIYTLVPGLTGFIAKNDVEHLPILNHWMRNLKCLFLDRVNAREGLKTILTGIEQIKAGTSMFIAPEGTRNHGEDMLPFKPGSLKIAEKTGCPIVPIAITNADNIWENQFPKIRAVDVTIEFGEPILVASLDAAAKKELLSTCQETIRTMLAKNA